MSREMNITRIDLEASSSKAAKKAEENLFAHYGLEYEEHFVSLNEPDLRIRVLEVGSGRPVVMVPGGSGDAWPMAALMAELEGWRMIAINRPGSGLSDAVDHRQVDLRRLASEVIRSTADAFELDSFPIICNSMGGLWSSWFTLEYPERVSRMVQMGCPAITMGTSAPLFMRLVGVPGINRLVAPLMQPKDSESALQALLTQGSYQEDIDKLPEEMAETAYRFWNIPTYLDNWKTLIAAVVSISGAREKYALGPNQLGSIRQPAQFIWGQNDVFGGLDIARQIIEVMPNADLHEMDTGHLPFMDRPEETGRVIQEFLGQETATKEPMLALVK